MTNGIDQINPIQTSAGTAAQVAARLRDAIASGQLQPGTRLREPALAVQLMVSRTPVREALARLEAEGLVKRVPYRGAIVAELTSEQVAEAYMLRGLLEGFATRLATPKLSKQDHLKLRALIREIEESAKRGRSAELDALHREFHFTIYSQCASSKLVGWISELYSQFPKSLKRTARLQEPVAEYYRILEALESGDADLAGEEMTRHIKNGTPANAEYFGHALTFPGTQDKG